MAPRTEVDVENAAEVNSVAALDLRRQKQISNQRDSINRLLEGATYDGEMARLHEELAAAQARLEELTRG